MALHIDRYEIKAQLGQGAQARVYLAHDPKLNRDVAIKVFVSRADQPKLRERFQREARVIAGLHHPNILQLFDYSGDEADDLYLVTELVPGRDLNDHTYEHGRMSEATTIRPGALARPR